MLTQSRFLELAAINKPNCLSIYLPKADITEIKKDQIKLKNRLKEARQELEETDISPQEINKMMKPIELLSSDMDWWRNDAEGLALFHYGEEPVYEFGPIDFDKFTYVADHLYLRPLAPLVDREEKALLLVISAKDTRLFHVSLEGITESDMGKGLPQNLQDVVGHDYEQKALQYRTGQGEQGQGQYHGHGSGSDKENQEEYQRFLAQVSQEITDQVTVGSQPPRLILACVDYVFSMFKEESRYPNLHPESISGNFDHADPNELHEKVKPILEHLQGEEDNQCKERLHNLLGTAEASDDPQEIIPAAIGGRVEILFVKKGEHLWGSYEAEDHSIRVDEASSSDNVSLLNQATIETIKNGGKVVLIEEEDDAQKPVLQALFRYAR